MTWSKPRPEVRDPWFNAVIRSPMSNATKLLMAILVDDMGVHGSVSVPRTRLAGRLNVHPARITERMREAIDAGWLSTVRKGRPGVTAEYQAMIPKGADVSTKRRRRRDPAYGADARTKQPADMVRTLYQVEARTCAPGAERGDGAHVQSASTTHPTCTDSPNAVGEKRNDEERRERSRVNRYGVGHCVVCDSFEKLGDDNLCRVCVIGAAVTRTGT